MKRRLVGCELGLRFDPCRTGALNPCVRLGPLREEVRKNYSDEQVAVAEPSSSRSTFTASMKPAISEHISTSGAPDVEPLPPGTHIGRVDARRDELDCCEAMMTMRQRAAHERSSRYKLAAARRAPHSRGSPMVAPHLAV